MKKTITFLLICFLLNHFTFSQMEEIKKDSLTLEEELEQYYYEEMEADFLDTFPKVKEVEEQPVEEMIFKVVEDVPVFPGCEHLKDSLKEMNSCTEQKILAFIYSKLQYPPKAIANKTEGKVWLKFHVDRQGVVSKVEILKNIGNGCGEEAKRALLLMNKEKRWRHTSARDRVVKIRCTLPIVFKLNSKRDQKN